MEFLETSEPAGIVNRTTYPEEGARTATSEAPGVTLGYRFTHWTLNGVRAVDDTGRAANPASFVVTAPIHAVAHYINEHDDTDGDGLNDAWELEFFDSLDTAPSDDFDGDGFDAKLELHRGLHVRAVDRIDAGGISRRRAAVSELYIEMLDLDLDRDGFRRSMEICRGYEEDVFDRLVSGGVSRRRGQTTAVVQNVMVYARLIERSEPVGIVETDRIVPKGTVLLTTAPESWDRYRFVGWYRAGIRVTPSTAGNPTPFPVDEDMTLVARYVDTLLDTDGDGIPDWQEWLHFDSLTTGSGESPDDDTLPTGLELFRGYVPSNPDTIMAGGVSRRRSGMTSVTLSDAYARLTETSEPRGIVDAERIVANHAPCYLATAPESWDRYRFVGWYRDGVRATPSTAGNPYLWMMDGSVTLTARYVDSALDTDSDGIPDWQEWLHFDSLATGPDDDPDGDVFPTGHELFRGYVPSNVDTILAGGVSRRRGGETAVNAIFLDMPPDVTLVSPTDVTETAVTLNAWVNPRRFSAIAYFEYVLRDGTLVQTDVQTLDVGMTPVPISAVVTNLSLGTVYRYRVVASNEIGRTVSPDGVFGTLWDGSTPEGFEDGEVGDRWQMGGWQVGAPAGGPGAAYFGQSCAGNRLNEPYADGADDRMITPVFEVPPLEQLPHLVFAHWWRFAPGDSGYVEIREGAAEAWQTLATYSGDVGFWHEAALDLSAFAGRYVQVAFRMAPNGDGQTSEGWFVDGIGIRTGLLDTRDMGQTETFQPSNFWTNWVVQGYGWVVGVPQAAPAAFDGDTCAGAGLECEIPVASDSRLVSAFFSVPGTNVLPRLRFWQRRTFVSGDWARLEVREVGGSWQTVKNYSTAQADWGKEVVALSAYAGKTIQVGFRSVRGYSAGGRGWFLDGVRLVTDDAVLPQLETFAFGRIQSDWETDNEAVWQIGAPTVGPPEVGGSRAYSPSNCAATVLGGDYPRSGSARLVSPMSVVPVSPHGSKTVVRFRQWYHYAAGDGGQVQIAALGETGWGAWSDLPDGACAGISDGWVEATVDVEAYAGRTVRLGFLHVANGDSQTGPGWYVDDLAFGEALLPRYTVRVDSAHGTVSPDAGSYTVIQGDTFAVAVTPMEVMGVSTQYVCRGWVGTGSVPIDGIGTNVSFEVLADSSLIWQWSTNYWVEVGSGEHGQVDFTNGWYEAGDNVTLVAVPDANHRFAGWTGTLEGVATNSPVLTVPVTQARNLHAHFMIDVNSIVGGADMVWRMGGVAAWFEQSDVVKEGLWAMRSGAIGDNQESWIEATVEGRGTLTFWWRVSSEGAYDYLSCEVDGALDRRISGHKDGWRLETLTFTNQGPHTIRWRYSKDATESWGLDCGWLDEVRWMPTVDANATQTTPVPVPFVWLDLFYSGLSGAENYETMAMAIGANGYSVWESYVAGLDPTNTESVLKVDIAFTGDQPQVTWQPDLGSARVYTVLGKTNLTEAVWHAPATSGSRFFKVRVDLP